MIDPKATTVELDVAGNSYAIKQSPTLLRSNRDDGTTGAVAWKSSVLFTEWIINLLDEQIHVKAGEANFIELGCGVSAVTALALSHVANLYLATDQNYVRRLFEENFFNNKCQSPNSPPTSHHRAQHKQRLRGSGGSGPPYSIVSFTELDWHAAEDVRGLKSLSRAYTGGERAFDFILANDCIYNESLISPLVNMCASLCQLQPEGRSPTLVLVGQQLRSHSVYETWLTKMLDVFRVWRAELPTNLPQPAMGRELNFVVNIAMLRLEPQDQG